MNIDEDVDNGEDENEHICNDVKSWRVERSLGVLCIHSILIITIIYLLDI